MLNNDISLYFHSSALHIAIEKGSTKIIQILLSHQNIDINARNIIFV